MVEKIMMSLLLLFWLATLLGAYFCAWGIAPAYAFMPVAVIGSIAILMLVVIVFKHW